MYVNDIVDNLFSLTRLFADDSSLSVTSNDIKEIEVIINYDLHQISKWAKQWMVNFNPNKTEAMFFSNTINEYPKVAFDNVNINFVPHHKHLGVTLSDDCKWQLHISNIIKSASKVLSSMRLLKFKLSRNTLNNIYITYMRPLLEYASVVWDGCSQNDKEKLEKLQHEAARIVTGLTKSTSIQKLLQEIGWVSLTDRRTINKLTIMYKHRHNELPSYLHDILTDQIAERTRYNLRNNDNYETIVRRTELFNQSFVPSAVTLWNNLEENIRSSPSLTNFELKLNRRLFLDIS